MSLSRLLISFAAAFTASVTALLAVIANNPAAAEIARPRLAMGANAADPAAPAAASAPATPAISDPIVLTTVDTELVTARPAALIEP